MATGVAQNLKKEENVIVDAGRWIKVSTNRTGASSATRDSGGNFEDEKSATWGAA